MAQKNYVSNSTESIRMFDKDWMEALSKVHFTVPLIFFVPIISILYYLGIVSGEVTLMNGLLWGAFGLLTWTVTEYMLHRFIFHYHPTSEFGKKIHFIFHGVHHDYPRDRLRLVMPPSVSLPLATLFFFLFDALIAGAALFPFFGSFLLGYLIYDMFHYAIHHLEVKGKLWNVLKTHHLKHHYVNPDKGYGVSSPIWDYIIGTEFEESKTKAQVSHD
jgi:sterol desaturase/sphingolipid hydroxylase (fatty acid hydroxylase superfamily)